MSAAQSALDVLPGVDGAAVDQLAVDIDNTFTAAGYERVDAFAAYDFSPDLG